jgi:hypothetical protein
VIRSTEERHIIIPSHEECEVLVGLGMRTQADGHTLLLGSPGLLRDERFASAARPPTGSAVCGVRPRAAASLTRKPASSAATGPSTEILSKPTYLRTMRRVARTPAQNRTAGRSIQRLGVGSVGVSFA